MKSFWSLNRRALLKLLPSSLLGWVLARPKGEKSARAVDTPVSTEGDANKWVAEWIWEPIEVGPPGGPSGVPFSESRPLKNLFGHLRRTFDLSAGVRRALVRVSADSRYKLYVNGHYVGRLVHGRKTGVLIPVHFGTVERTF